MSRRRTVPLFALCLVAALAGGCAPFDLELGTEREALAPEEESQPDLAEARLVEAAVRAEAALTALARIRAAETPLPAAEVPLTVPPALLRPVTLSWIGPLATLAETLAARSGYRFMVAGAPPVRPVMVAIEAEDAPLIEVLRDAGLQAGDAATLTVDAEERSVRLDWAAAPLPSRPGAPVAASGEEGA